MKSEIINIFQDIKISNKTKIYLIANNKNIPNNLFNLINIYDIVICFNKSIHINKLKDNRYKILFMRGCAEKYGYYWG